MVRIARSCHPTILRHHLGEAHGEHGLNVKAAADPQNLADGDYQLSTLLITNSPSITPLGRKLRSQEFCRAKGEGTGTAPQRGCLGKADSSLKVLQPQPSVGAGASLLAPTFPRPPQVLPCPPPRAQPQEWRFHHSQWQRRSRVYSAV